MGLPGDRPAKRFSEGSLNADTSLRLAPNRPFEVAFSESNQVVRRFPGFGRRPASVVHLTPRNPVDVAQATRSDRDRDQKRRRRLDEHLTQSQRVAASLGGEARIRRQAVGAIPDNSQPVRGVQMDILACTPEKLAESMAEIIRG